MSSRRERELTERLVQLSCILAEEDEEVPDIPDNACETWTEADVREYYRSKGAYTPEGEFAQGLVGQEVPGGSLEQNRKLRWSDPMDDIGTPPLDAAAYQEAAFEHGIPCRPDGLFPPSDPTLERLTKDPLFKPFEKQLVDKRDKLVSAENSWASGNSAAANSRIDLRCFLYVGGETSDGSSVGSRLEGAVRFGDNASIGNGFSAHGGAVETVLDEATAELCKATQGVMCYTTQADFKLKQPVALHKTYAIEAEITKLGIRGMRIFVDARLKDDQGNEAAVCSVQLANVAKISSRS
ncbi:hypothetical protein HOP50_15g74420 [Chloropicon primus]|uniref:Thioesterase domain-containing protein n=1 Tax=Chloropicon primus TaxID=1764295 RepID=A0A5B8MVS3_9CHLO|nr:hypothetical protein A3770_15p74160 [Chloropicon primus]UPR04108.1 hypothetical protein HOP50_15g74420 [Chloropicon primus]|eukprot:QDZ24898.1 hypothetical protein A3770_15p74160 [Chloropicon primus]